MMLATFLFFSAIQWNRVSRSGGSGPFQPDERVAETEGHSRIPEEAAPPADPSGIATARAENDQAPAPGSPTPTVRKPEKRNARVSASTVPPARILFGDRPGDGHLVLSLDEFVRRKQNGKESWEKLDPAATIETLAARLEALAGDDIILPVAYPEAGPKNAATRRLVTRDLRVLADQSGADRLARQHGLEPVASPALVGNERLFRARDPIAALAVAGELRALAPASRATVVLAANRSKRALPNDPLVTSQWHLKKTAESAIGTDVNVEPVWNYPGTGNRGTGIRVGIIDDGVQTNHPDFAGNIDTTNDKDWNGNGGLGDTDPSPETGDDHGTPCAGNVAARGNNGIGVAGTAPEAVIVGMRLISGSPTDVQEAEAMLWRNDIIPIKSNSWGPEDDGITLEAPGTSTLAAFQTATSNGRGGRGTILLFAGGNGAIKEDNSNKDGYANSIYTIAVGAINNQGTRAEYSERGANLVVCAPSDGSASQLAITTTDRTGADGYATGDYTTNSYDTGFGGTSSATPTVAGIVALVLQANPNLGWRDVQEILMKSARKVDLASSEWITNGGGFNFNHNYGAGLVDAAAAVTLATGWTNLGTATTSQSSQTALNVSIPDNNTTGITRTFSLASSNIRVEHVTLNLTINHTARGDLDIRLVSPYGTESRLAEVHGDGGNNYSNWTFSSVRHWGESSNGTWTLKISDRAAADTGTLASATLTVHGTSLSTPNNPPTITAASLTASGTAYADVPLGIASITASDPEGQPITYTYQWQSNADGLNYISTGPTTATLPASAANAAKLWRCVITPSDGNRTGTPFTTAAVNLVARPVTSAQTGSAYSYQSGLVLRGNAPTGPAPRRAIINEFSQGPNAVVGQTSEWIEILTLETTSLAYWDLQDSGTDLLVFIDTAVWDNIPAGTLIVIYNGGQPKDPALPADDTDPSDGRMVVSSTNPVYFDATYDPWIALGNSGDAIRLSDDAGTLVDSISYGNNATGTPQLGSVGNNRAAAFTGGSSADAEVLANWSVLGLAQTTPGLANGGSNTTWINSLRSPTPAQFRLGAGANVPAGLSINPTTGVLSGTIGATVAAGNYAIVIERFNGFGEVVSQSYVLAISTASVGFQGWIGGYPGLGVTTPVGDPDGDGLPNLVEYLLHNQSPAAADAGGAVVPGQAPGQITLTWRESTTTTGATLAPEWSNHPAGSSWSTSGITIQTLENLPTNRLRRATLLVDPAHPKRFLRLRASTMP